MKIILYSKYNELKLAWIAQKKRFIFFSRLDALVERKLQHSFVFFEGLKVVLCKMVRSVLPKVRTDSKSIKHWTFTRLFSRLLVKATVYTNWIGDVWVPNSSVTALFDEQSAVLIVRIQRFQEPAVFNCNAIIHRETDIKYAEFHSSFFSFSISFY